MLCVASQLVTPIPLLDLKNTTVQHNPWVYRCHMFQKWAGTAQSEWRLATSCTVQGSNPGGGEIFRTLPDRPWSPSSLLYNGYWFFPGSKAAGACRWPPTPSKAEVKERVDLYLYCPSGRSWPILGTALYYLYLFKTRSVGVKGNELITAGSTNSRCNN
jgi:hypothetical protein